MDKFFTSKNIAKIGIFSALATILYFVNFPLPFFPFFLELHFSDLPALICGFALGPLAGALTVIVKILIKLPFTETFCVGEMADLITGLAFVLPASLIYSKSKEKSSAIIGLLLGSICSVATSLLANRFVIIPFYLGVMNLTLETLAQMCSPVLPMITAKNFYSIYIFGATLPFNTLRCLISALFTFLVYKRISTLLKRWS